jgi:hypothetical protein
VRIAARETSGVGILRLGSGQGLIPHFHFELETKQYAAFVSWRRPFPACPSLWDENGCKERIRWGQLRVQWLAL